MHFEVYKGYKESYMRFLQDGLDCTIRSLIVAIGTDTYFCLFCPLLTLFACPAVRRNVEFLSRSRSYTSYTFILKKKTYMDFCNRQVRKEC